jgi:hypothetical protein
MIDLPSENDLRRYEADDLLDPSEPRKQHLAEEWAPQRRGPAALLRRATDALTARRG